MFAIGNDQLDQCPPLEDEIVCDQCGETHKIEYSEEVLASGKKIPSKRLGFYKCNDILYLAGIDGKDIRWIK